MSNPAVIAGAGPVGLMLAGELRLGGVAPIVLEQRTEPSGESRGVGFTERAFEVFDQRGLFSRFGDASRGQQVHFGGVHIDPDILPESHYGVRGVPQYQIEEVLKSWLVELGTSVRRGHALIGFRDTGDQVLVEVEGAQGRYKLATDYLVGCDGASSIVRKLAGIDFPGTPATRGMYLADVVGTQLKPRFIGERVPGGMVMCIRLQDGVNRIIIHEDDAPPPDPTRAPEFSFVADTWQRLTGESVHDAQVKWVSAFTDATRQAAEYRRGRVFVAGDAAHIHIPAGAQGLSVGVQDAVNLGWKLAAAITGWAPDGLLDTYHSERHPVGQRVLRNTRAQSKLYLSGDEMEPLRRVLGELMDIPEAATHLAGMVSGLDIRYPIGPGTHPLLGRRVPDYELELPEQTGTRMAPLLHRARGQLVLGPGVDQSTQRRVETLAAGWLDRVDLVRAIAVKPSERGGGAAPDAMLVRPDGYVAWTLPEGGDLESALRTWFGTFGVHNRL